VATASALARREARGKRQRSLVYGLGLPVPLRIKTNYEDPHVHRWPEDQLASASAQDLVALAGCTLLLHELHIAALVGRARFSTGQMMASPKLTDRRSARAEEDLLAAHAPT